jgi:hypothetical protein
MFVRSAIFQKIVKLSTAAAALIFLACPNAWALPDEEIQAMVRMDGNFRAAERRILRVWANLSADLKSELRREQIRWIKADRDREALEWMRRGKSKIESYTIVTNSRSNYLEEYALKDHENEIIDIIKSIKPNKRKKDNNINVKHFFAN